MTSIIVPALRDDDMTKACLESIEEHTPEQHQILDVIGVRGYPAAINRGLAYARGDTLCFLNNDTLVTAGWLGEMLKVLNRPNMGLVGPMSDNVSGPQSLGKEWLVGSDYIPTQRLVGFCLLVRREVVDKIGGLDERFGLGNFDDDDYCLRAIQAGYDLAIATRSFVHHIGGATFRAEGLDYALLMRTNWLIFKDKWGIPAHVEMGDPYTLDMSRV